MEHLEDHRDVILDDLRGLIGGEIQADEIYRQLYASDGSIFQIRPLAVVRPRNTADVVACVKYAAEKRIPLHARGAGSGVAGESLGPGLVIDFAQNMRRLVRANGESVRVQSGMVVERLGAQLRSQGRVFGPDRGHSEVTTIGGMIGVNGAGSRWLRYGSTRDRVQSLQVVTADGHLVEFGREPIAPTGVGDHPTKRRLVEQLIRLLRANEQLIAEHTPDTPIPRCGYHLSGLLRHDELDMVGLLCGSEGTLGLVTEATIATDPQPPHQGVALLLFASLDRAARAVDRVLADSPSACELMDRRHLSLARELEVRLDVLIPAEAEALLLVEHMGEDPLEVRDRLEALVDGFRQRREIIGARQTYHRQDIDLFWQLATKTQPALLRVRGPVRPVSVVEDIAVSPQRLPEFLPRVQNVLKRQQITASIYAHAGQGQLHVQPFLDVFDRAQVERMRRLADELYAEVFRVGGTISGEHGLGLARTAYLRQQLGPLYDVSARVKQIFDPANLFNPGKIVGDDAELLTRYLRPPLPVASGRPAEGLSLERDRSPASSTSEHESAGADDSASMRNLVELQLDWHPSEVAAAAADCTRCGNCRTQVAEMRMCPLFRIQPAEEASPRAKANLISGLLTGDLPLEQLTRDEFKQVADLCVHCHMCRLECPARVDIPRLMRESKGAYVAANGLPMNQWVLTRLELLDRWASLVSPAANWALRNRLMRWLGEKVLGIAQGRKLPRIASRPFLRRAARRRLTRPSRRSQTKVAYFVDLYANYHDPQLAEAVVAVLEHNGVEVYVPPTQRPAGMPSIATGALDHARHLARRNVATLAEAVRQGYHVVASEPAAALCLAREYPQLLNEEDAQFVAENSSEVCTYLWRLHRSGKLRLDFKPLHLTLGYHLPCHLAALEVGMPGCNLLQLIPALRLQLLREGCSGMAGTFGLHRASYRRSLRAGWRLISRLRDPDIQVGTTECSPCKMQMEQGTTKPTIHPIKLLALAYDLMPECQFLLTTQGEELTVT